VKTLKFKTPANWNQLSNRQVTKVANLFFSEKTGVIFDVSLFKIILNHQWYKFKLSNKIAKALKVVPLSEIKENYYFLYKSMTLTRFLPVLKIKKNSYFAPADRLSNITIGEFAICEDLFINFQNLTTNQEENFGLEYLQYLMAVLYVNSSDAKRPDFVKNRLDQQAKPFYKLNKKYCYATALAYKGCKEHIANLPKYAAIFPKPKETDLQSKQRKKLINSGLGDLILSLSGGVFGDYEKTFNTNLYLFLDHYAKHLKQNPKDETHT
jgi:hypothetical protein